MSYADRHYIGYGEAIDYDPLSGWINPARMADDAIEILKNAGFEINQITVNTDNDEILVSYEKGEDYFKICTDGKIIFFYDIQGLDHIECQLAKLYSLKEFKAIMKPTNTF